MLGLEEWAKGFRINGLSLTNGGYLSVIHSWEEEEAEATKWVFYKSGQLKIEWN